MQWATFQGCLAFLCLLEVKHAPNNCLLNGLGRRWRSWIGIFLLKSVLKNIGNINFFKFIKEYIFVYFIFFRRKKYRN